MQPELGQSTEICGNTTTVTGKHAPFNDSRTAAVSNPSSQKEMRCSKKQKRPQKLKQDSLAMEFLSSILQFVNRFLIDC
ncbi:uncharacterized protein LOC121276143 isoform X2 [Carcharodon carcharias]|uniref:uncharacterized protein LOC121276143 isoform X2 n=1 Tax=Carcharodon carcharias TaxID=13397 RepID=UPI001B7F1E34|nr:uncharacterized protein LOC121276143 isoform X2 [Carcharodon carcharias]